MENVREYKIKHLEMIEAVIKRMANNSFLLKGWSVTLIGVAGTLSTTQNDKRFIILSLIPIFAFWILDSYYLQLERKFRVKYKNVMDKSDDIDFDMNPDKIVVENKDEENKLRLCNCFFSATEGVFYGTIAVAELLLTLILINNP